MLLGVSLRGEAETLVFPENSFHFRINEFG